MTTVTFCYFHLPRGNNADKSVKHQAIHAPQRGGQEHRMHPHARTCVCLHPSLHMQQGIKDRNGVNSDDRRMEARHTPRLVCFRWVDDKDQTV